MTKVKIDFTSKIIQGKDSETFKKTADGELVESAGNTRVSYLEDGKVPVKILIREGNVIIRRGTDRNNYSQLHFVVGEREDCRYVAQGYQMDLQSTTEFIKFFPKNNGSSELQIEYNLYSGLYLVGNYTVTLIFT
ncbi:DUF1934 domain-containing protein [Lactobacillus sp. M0396]|uniref:DUF1934 domain-containing protein n=1 Tax=Lactobacillus sp. M0396 TaxID=2751030 RepID=UPI0018DDCC49|nr:DUF1934 domain-containing protein [Lactobacillus sp. M0396]MBI0033149.1 DUF1934 domain-containing protein [Lactobacillus sp. M0396]